MKFALLLLSLLVSTVALADFDRFHWEMNPTSSIKSNLKSCYRWMSGAEMSQWKSKGPQAYEVGRNESQWLGRDGEIGKGIYCWHHPTGAIRGGIYETYGENLVRIDFVEDVVLYDRSRRLYFSANGAEVPEDLKKGVDTEVFYGNYLKGFQEYIIKNPRAIKSFTFNDAALKTEFAKGYEDFQNGALWPRDIHFYFTSYCPFKSKPEHARYALRANNDKLFICYETRETLKDRKKHLESNWKNSPERTFENSRVRALRTTESVERNGDD